MNDVVLPQRLCKSFNLGNTFFSDTFHFMDKGFVYRIN